MNNDKTADQLVAECLALASVLKHFRLYLKSATTFEKHVVHQYFSYCQMHSVCDLFVNHITRCKPWDMERFCFEIKKCMAVEEHHRQIVNFVDQVIR